LLGDHLVGESAIAFRELVDYAYRMTVAYAHELNLPRGATQNLANQALSLVTLDEVEAFARMLRRRTRDYCGMESIDCDSANNVEVLRYSIRDQLFPQLMDVVDARTGKVVTAGEQFHNTITTAPYLRRRVRGVHLTDQVELNISVPVTLQESRPGGPAWLIDPLTCNHLLDARDPAGPLDPVGLSGTVALNVVARNADEDEAELRYELIRGAVDFIRSCHPESVVEEIGTLPAQQYPIRKHLIGYAPQSDQGRMDSPPSYVTRSASFSACLNQPRHAGKLQDAPCWRFFSRDRSLASSDWKLVIPVHIGGGATANTWILGEGLPAEDRPVIEDLVLYFRYRARPIQE
jgi:hypothetical protein